jgi:hypothetical protein
MKKNILKGLSLLLAMSFLTSCLKDNSLILDPAKGTNVIEFKNPSQISSPAGSILPLYAFAYDIVPETTLPLTVSYSGPEAVAPQDITVKFAIQDQAVLDTYNDDQETHYELIDPAVYTLPVTELVIKKGESKASTTITFRPNTFDLAASYALPLKITSVSSGTISGNFGTIIIAVNAKNKWDGVYKAVAGTFADVPNPTWSIFNPAGYEYYMQTQGANTIAIFDPTYFGTYIQVFRTSPTGVSGYGSFSPVFTFDANNNITSIVNFYGQPAGNGRSAAINPAGQNKFIKGTPGTAGSQFQASWTLYQPGTTVRSQSNYTFEYIGPRP